MLSRRVWGSTTRSTTRAPDQGGGGGADSGLVNGKYGIRNFAVSSQNVFFIFTISCAKGELKNKTSLSCSATLPPLPQDLTYQCRGVSSPPQYRHTWFPVHHHVGHPLPISRLCPRVSGHCLRGHDGGGGEDRRPRAVGPQADLFVCFVCECASMR